MRINTKSGVPSQFYELFPMFPNYPDFQDGHSFVNIGAVTQSYARTP